MPWDQNTPIGYVMMLITVSSSALAYYITVGILLISLISICWHHVAFYEIFERELYEFDRTERTLNHIFRLIRYHSSIRTWVHMKMVFFLFQPSKCSFYSWFKESAEAYSPFVLILLIASVMMLACSLFQVDLVSVVFIDILLINLKCICAGILFLGTQTCGFHTSRSFSSCCNQRAEFICVLLFWKIGYRTTWTNVWRFIWVQLVWISHQYTKMSFVHDYECSTTIILSRIWRCYSKLGNVLQSENNWIIIIET